ncbi:MAG: hypothetical protein EXR69_01930 [Myxococcales bacterium]|nr:hypothetical protein [Myxococcales bacterium]
MTAIPSGFYGRLARWVMHHRAITVSIAAALTVLAALGCTQLRLDSDILALMPQDEPSTQALKRLDEEEGGVNFLTIAADADDPVALNAFMDDLQARIEKLPNVSWVLWKVDPEVTWRIGLLQLPVEDLVTMRDRLRAALSLGPAMVNPFIAARVLDLGPITAKLQNAGDTVRLSSAEGTARLVVRPTISAHDLPAARTFMHTIDAALLDADAPAHGVTIEWLGGAYRHNVEDYEGIAHDIWWITSASVVMVLMIIAGAFRSPKAVVLIFAPLIVSNIWTLGVAGATVGALNTFTSFVNAVLVGLGVEFGVHLYARYREMRESGLDLEEAVVKAWDACAGACTSASLTSAAGFAALLAAHFAGFRQLGWLLSLGLVLCLLSEIVLMPVLITLVEKRGPVVARVRRWHVKGRRPSTYRLAPVALMVIASLTLVCALLAPRIGIEYDLSALRRSGLSYEELTEKQRALARDSYAPLVVSYDTEAAMTAEHEKLTARLKDNRLPLISKVLSVRTVIPSDQADRVAILLEIAELANDPSARFLPPPVAKNLQKLRDLGVTMLTPSDLPIPLQAALGGQNGRHRLMLVPSGNMWDMREAAALTAWVEREFAGEDVAGEYLTLGTLFRLLNRDAPIVAAIAMLLVMAFTAADLREIKATFAAVAVLLAGMAWWGALLVMSNIKISIVSGVGIPITLGIGIDVMIHLIHRLKQEGPGGILRALTTTGWASALGTSTTVVAFAALSLAGSQGIRSLGLLVLLGESAVTVAGFVLVPLGFATAWRLQGRHPQALSHGPPPPAATPDP